MADPLFYDSPDNSKFGGSEFEIVSRGLPSGWTQSAKGEWVVCVPPGGMAGRSQGWKIHVSAGLGNAERVVEQVWDYCVGRDISFKYLRGKLSLLMRNAKYAPRGGSGKFITIYPADDAQFELILADLDRLVGGEPGPYILSDLRYGDGPLYVRYGGFTERYCEDDDGEPVTAIEDASGRLVPDRRGPVFAVPEWVELPGFLAPHLAASKAVTMADLPYRVEEALHFSNGGGVYLATDTRNGEKVILKEARPFAGLSADGMDAVARLRRERDILTELDGLGSVPAVRDYFERAGHHFLVQEFIEGKPLNSCYAERYPLIQPDPDPAETRSYADWALRIFEGAAAAIRQVHSRGIVFNDLHMFNIMVRPDDSVALLDFEAAARIDEDKRPVIGNPGFVAPRDRTGFDIDRYSLACLRLAMFLPLTMLLPLDRGKAADFAEAIAGHFPVPPGYLDDAVREITRGVTKNSRAVAEEQPAAAREPAGPVFPGASLEAAEALLARAILASATPAREDRLFPGDIRQFAGEALGLAHGAAGVLYALADTGSGRFPEFEDWLVSRATAPAPGTRLGLYDGLLGAACALAYFGRAADAVKVAGLCTAERWERLGYGLHGGTAGLALGLLYLGDAAGEPALTDAGMRAVELTASRLTAESRRPAEGRDRARAGLMHGGSGPALLFVRMYERTGDSGYLDLASAALHRELDACVPDRGGALVVDEGWRTLPYLGNGSAGIGLVAQEYLIHADDERFAEAVPRIRQAARARFYVQSGLLAGRAGMLLTADAAEIEGHARRLGWHAIPYAGGVAFPGDDLLRLSMDLATGTAGVLLALHRARCPGGEALPFLGSMTSRHAVSATLGTREARR